MACTNCSTSVGNAPGCKSKGACSTGNCGKMPVFNWLSNMSLPAGKSPFDILEVRFKNGRKEFFKNKNNLNVHMGDSVAVEGTSGHDIGIVSLKGELVRLQMRKKKVEIESEEVNDTKKINQNVFRPFAMKKLIHFLEIIEWTGCKAV